MSTLPIPAGLSILIGGLTFVGASRATELVVNGRFENIVGGTPQYGGITDGSAPGWKGLVSTLPFAGTSYFAGPPIPASENPGSAYSWRHQSAVDAYNLFATPAGAPVLAFALVQVVALTNAIAEADIDAGRGTYSFSAWLSSYTANPEQPLIVLKFFDATGATEIGLGAALDRATTNHWNGNAGVAGVVPLPAALTNAPAVSNHHWARYRASSIVPQGARSATIYITRSPAAGLSGSPDTYVDLVQLDVRFTNEQPSIVETASPLSGATFVDPLADIVVTLRDGTAGVDLDTVQLWLNGFRVAASVQKPDAVTHVLYHPPAPLPAGSTNSYAIVFSDNGSPGTIQSNVFVFAVTPPHVVPSALIRPDHVVVLMDENRGYSEIIGNLRDAPYINSLLPIAASMTDSHGEQHPTDPNYLYLFSGANQGLGGNDTLTNLPLTTPNLAAQLLRAGFSFADYAEDLPSVGDLTPVVNGPHGTYYLEENVAGYWISTASPPPSSNNLPPSVLRPLSSWPSDFRQLPTIAFVHSVEQNDMHEGYWPNTAATIQNGDAWIRTHLDPYVRWAMTNNSLFILTWDEDNFTDANRIPTLFVGPMIKPGNYSDTINHFHVLRTLEDLFGLPYAGAAAMAAPIVSIWRPQLHIAPMPGGRLTISWENGGTLQAAARVEGPYVDLPSAISPFQTEAMESKFFRVRP